MMETVRPDSNPEYSDSKSLDSGVENNFSVDNLPSNEASLHVSDEESYQSDKENVPEVTNACLGLHVVLASCFFGKQFFCTFSGVILLFSNGDLLPSLLFLNNFIAFSSP